MKLITRGWVSARRNIPFYLGWFVVVVLIGWTLSGPSEPVTTHEIVWFIILFFGPPILIGTVQILLAWNRGSLYVRRSGRPRRSADREKSK